MLIIPPQAILLPLYMQFQSFDLVNMFTLGLFELYPINLINTFVPGVLMSLTASAFKNGLFIYMMLQHFRNMPFVLEEAAWVDGCNPYHTFFVIMLPSATPIMAAVFLLSFVWQWSDYYYTSALMPNLPMLSTSFVGIGGRYVSATGQPFNEVLSQVISNTGCVLMMLPLLILFIFTQKFFVQGVERTGIVG